MITDKSRERGRDIEKEEEGEEGKGKGTLDEMDKRRIRYKER